jgi:hypothetical protein
VVLTALVEQSPLKRNSRLASQQIPRSLLPQRFITGFTRHWSLSRTIVQSTLSFPFIKGFTACGLLSCDVTDRFETTFIHSFIHSVVCLVTIHSFFPSESSAECDLVLPLSVYSIPSFPQYNPVAASVFFLIFPSFLSAPISFLQ